MIAAALSVALLLAGEKGPKPAASIRWTRVGPAGRDLAVEAAIGSPLPQRIVSMSEGFLGTPYLHSPLGEGSGKDPDPAIRFDAVDCLTFVEQTLAMSLAPRAGEVQPLLQALRYAGAPTYEDRNHLMEAQWLPNNVSRGFLRALTGELGGEGVVEIEKKLTARTWTGKSALALGLPKSRRVEGVFRLPIVPIARALAVARKAPSGTVLVVVRQDRPLLVTRVSHLGFLIQKKRPVLRHASRTFGRVVDEDLEAFLSRNLGYARWTVDGLAFYEARAPGAAGSSPEAAAQPP